VAQASLAAAVTVALALPLHHRPVLVSLMEVAVAARLFQGTVVLALKALLEFGSIPNESGAHG
jgi:hypothetical protein